MPQGCLHATGKRSQRDRHRAAQKRSERNEQSTEVSADTHGVRLHTTSLPEDAHRRTKVWLESSTDRERDITKARQDRDLHVPVQHFALQVLQQHIHEWPRVRGALIAERAGEIADDADCNRAELGIFVRLESRCEVREEGLHVGCEALLKRDGQGANYEEGVLEDS